MPANSVRRNNHLGAQLQWLQDITDDNTIKKKYSVNNILIKEFGDQLLSWSPYKSLGACYV